RRGPSTGGTCGGTPLSVSHGLPADELSAATVLTERRLASAGARRPGGGRPPARAWGGGDGRREAVAEARQGGAGDPHVVEGYAAAADGLEPLVAAPGDDDDVARPREPDRELDRAATVG